MVDREEIRLIASKITLSRFTTDVLFDPMNFVRRAQIRNLSERVKEMELRISKIVPNSKQEATTSH
ncbi:hypothetical protein A3A76_06115 [Candidatus Woesebacteria bacterium RIFCSPLOWO2_01_FULL_39_23]|nr:MAG: hypothetical protein A3E41_04460 [Candidatus Woesebacteria bacterium RIFCSPHIGHO2_12_FULL_38_9]OGM63252.1 MAG: hypothetical protein A3A76_06115 [Candidatus Woesebacteria bacterium RIFCSPLOWO2_01_FULL_39_23]